MKISTWTEYESKLKGLRDTAIEELIINNLNDSKNNWVVLENLTINKVSIEGDCLFNFALHNCKIVEFNINHKQGEISVHFRQCDIENFGCIAEGKVDTLEFWDCGTIITLFIGFSIVKELLIFSVKELLSLSVTLGAKIDNCQIRNQDVRDSDGKVLFWGETPKDKIINEAHISVEGVRVLQIGGSNFGMLKLSKATTHNSIELTDVCFETLNISDFANPSIVFDNVRFIPTDIDLSKTIKFYRLNNDAPRIYIDSVDLSSSTIMNCDFSLEESVFNQVLMEDSRVLNTKWPKKLKGSHSNNQSAFRQLKIFHQKQGNFRLQLDYYALEMWSFKLAERQRIKSISGVFNKAKEWIEYLVKVFLPYHASSFGVFSWKPLFWYMVFILVAINAFILIQGDDLGIKYTFYGEVDFSLFWHLILPTHDKEFNGIILNQSIDVLWRIIASFLLYHLIVSSRKLLQER